MRSILRLLRLRAQGAPFWRGRFRHGSVVREMATRVNGRHPYCYRDDMIRTTISMPDELLQRLRLIAAERRTSMAALVREALEDKAKSYGPLPRSLGIGSSGRKDTARRTAEERAEPRPWR